MSILDEYYFHKHPELCIKIEDILKWIPGQELNIAMIDWNFSDQFTTVTTDQMKKFDQLYSPTIFYGGNRHRLIYEKDFQGHIYWGWGKDREMDDFYIEYKPDHWKMIKEIDWKDFPVTTRIGWRGPMVLWSHIERLEKEGYMCLIKFPYEEIKN